MLPFTKRTARSDASDLRTTGDIEVLPAARRSSVPPPPASRPRVFTRSVSDEEMTTLLPRKGMTFSARPPAPVKPMPMPKLTPSSRPPKVKLEEPPTRQFVLPSAPPPSVSPVAAPPPSVSPVAGPPRSSARPHAQLAPQHERAALKPQPVPVPVAQPKSDPRIDPPATVVTARTRIVMARPTMSWAAALVATGVFVGLVTAVVARGDADTLIDATASLVDPSGGHAAAAPGEAVIVQTKAEERRTTLLASVDTLLPEPSVSEVRTAAADTAAATPLPPRPAPVAYVAPAPHHTSHVSSRPVPAREERVASSAPAKSAPKPAATPAPKPAAHASDDESESASAADALAKAQLEASLR